MYDEDLDAFDSGGADDGTLAPATVEAIRRGRSSVPDVEAAERLVDAVAGLMVAVSTGGPRIDDVQGDFSRAYRALAAVLRRLDVENPNSFADLWTWYGKWSSDSDLGSWASRRTFVADLYAPVRAALEAKTDARVDVAAGTDAGQTGWTDVDAKLETLRRRVRESDNTDDYKAVGLQCIAALEALGRAAFNPEHHLPEGEDVPHPNDARRRLGYFLASVTGGDRFENVRPIIRGAWRQAEAVKHRAEPNATDAGIAADSTSLLVAITRRLADEDRQWRPDDDLPF